MQIITPNGFSTAEAIDYLALADLGENTPNALELPNNVDLDAIELQLSDIKAIRIPFPSSHDGRGFSLAKRLRDKGYKGTLRASGHLISDQFRYALDVGFDEVEVVDSIAARQPEEHWDAETDLMSYRDKLKQADAPEAAFPIPDGVFAETVTEVEHYTDSLFRFRITRPQSFRFRSGEFVMIGLPNAEKPIYRAYSIASPSWDETLEFYSIKVANGPLTEHLQKIQNGDTVLLKKKATGTLVNDALIPGKRLWLLSTGTGIAPFASVIRDPETYEKFDDVFLIHTCREKADLKYGYDLMADIGDDPLVGEEAASKLHHYATTTREPSEKMGRVTDLIENGRLFEDLGISDFSADIDRVMICGSMDMLKDTKALCEKLGLNEGANNKPGEYVVERAFVG